nr:M91 family zinc metallopeptidase [uncultured Psychroserpens sp.]
MVASGSDEFLEQYNRDIEILKKDEKFSEMIAFLESHELTVEITEAFSLIGALQNAWSEGSGDDNHVLASKTKISAGGVYVEYSQIEGVEIDGVQSESSEVLIHELTHAFDYFGSGGYAEMRNDEKVAEEKGMRGGEKAKYIRMRAESRAMNNANRLRKRRGKRLRLTYDGSPILENVESAVYKKAMEQSRQINGHN